MNALWIALVALVPADESLKDKACRSVHLAYPGKDTIAFFNEVTVQKSAPGTYFCAIGWNKGYFGIQELANKKHIALFSVWDDDKQDDPKAVPDEQRVKLLHKGESVRIGRFGGEGTGGQSFLDLNWQLGKTYGFLVTAKPNGARTEYHGWVKDPDQPNWFHMVGFSTITGGKTMTGFYSFIEDFKRDGASAKITRQASYGNAWLLGSEANAEWAPVTKARFTADANPALTIDAFLLNNRFVLATGGTITNKNTPLRQSLPDAKPGSPPKIEKDLLFHGVK
ncbi:MAG: DUF3472 domain-containing protein [Planctomycetota bacterium]|nr:DUF3472 domain-containing protein [Planctomycetota bacterium]